jgi:hypothetical protein
MPVIHQACHCHVFADAYKRARKAHNQWLNYAPMHVKNPELEHAVAETWQRYELERCNCPFRDTVPHY